MQLTSTNEKREYTVSNEKILNLSLPQPTDRECAFILGVRKSGSTLLNKIIIDLCKYNNLPYFSIAEHAFQQNLRFKDWTRAEELQEVIKDGIIYSGFRALPSFLSNNELFNQRKKILLVRDPRDAIVSQFFTVAFNHSIPKENSVNANGAREELLNKRELVKNQPIDEYVIKSAVGLRNTLKAYVKFINSPLTLVFRYEDVLLNKKPWIQEMAQFLNLEADEKILKNILDRVDIVPDKENPKNFIRKAVPGDHKNKLQPETIDQLNEIFAEVLNSFNYA